MSKTQSKRDGVVRVGIASSTLNRIRQLQQKIGLEREGDVILNALRLYEDVVKQAHAGNVFLIEKTNGEVELYRIFD